MPPQSPIQNQAVVTPLSDKYSVTMKTFLSYGLVVTAVGIAVSVVLSALTPARVTTAQSFSFGGAIFGIIFQGIAWIVCGLLFAALFTIVRDIIKGIPGLNTVINSTYDLLWKPYLAFNVITFIFAVLAIFGITTFLTGSTAVAGGLLFVRFIVTTVGFAVNLYTYNWFAKLVSQKLASYYPW
jgi:hypothetical protein